MEEEGFEEGNPWVDLSTVTNFDKGINSRSTRCVDEQVVRATATGKNKNMVKKISSSSILIGSLVNQLCTLLENDPDKKKRLYLLLCETMHKMKLIDKAARGFEFVQEKYVDAMWQLIKVARATIARDSIPRPFATQVQQHSFYQDQFRETGFIAVGGFGSVFKAVHKLDEVEYAIKKIIVKSGKVATIVQGYLEEVKTLAKLNHANIVSYKQAWIESMETAPCTMMQLPSMSRSQGLDIYDSSLMDYKSENKRQLQQQEGRIKRQEVHTTIGDESDVVSFREEGHITSENEQDIVEISSSTESSDSSFEDRRVCQYSARASQCTILYIQMALCERTLRQWLDDRRGPTPILLVADIAAQILCGLNYIHSLKVVHHDIKPSNIFITTSGKLEIQLGDFGLACPLQRVNHEAIVGTHMYAAPEQLLGECNPKSDVYSLGILLLELLIPMQTTMECIEMVKRLQDGGTTSHLGSDLKWMKIVGQLIQKDPARRPCTSKLLQELKMDKDETISRLQNENSRLRLEKELLQYKNEQKEETIEKQKALIEELQAALDALKSK